MDVDERVHFYRLLDATYGLLESSERIREELIKTRQRSLVNRLLVLLLTISAAVPTLYSLLPDTIGKAKEIYVIAFGVAAFAFAVVAALQWWDGRREAREVDSSLDQLSEPFFLFRTSSYLTRWIMASAIHRAAPPGRLRDNFREIKLDWEYRLRSLHSMLDDAVAARRIDDEARSRMSAWMSMLEDDNAGQGDGP